MNLKHYLFIKIKVLFWNLNTRKPDFFVKAAKTVLYDDLIFDMRRHHQMLAKFKYST